MELFFSSPLAMSSRLVSAICGRLITRISPLVVACFSTTAPRRQAVSRGPTMWERQTLLQFTMETLLGTSSFVLVTVPQLFTVEKLLGKRT